MPVTFELRDDQDFGEPPTDFDTAELYEERCENDVDENGNLMEEPCGGRLVAIGGHGYYNGSYQCYTLTLECEFCGTYDVECV